MKNVPGTGIFEFAFGSIDYSGSNRHKMYSKMAALIPDERFLVGLNYFLANQNATGNRE